MHSSFKKRWLDDLKIACMWAYDEIPLSPKLINTLDNNSADRIVLHEAETWSAYFDIFLVMYFNIVINYIIKNKTTSVRNMLTINGMYLQ